MRYALSMSHRVGSINPSRSLPMKTSFRSLKTILAIVAGLPLFTSGALLAQEKLVIDSFDSDPSAAAWSATWGSTPVLSWDSQDAKGSATSGSLRVSADYFTP